MFQAELLLSGSSRQSVRSALLWMADLEVLVQTDTHWPIDQRLNFSLSVQGETADGVLEVRGWHRTGEQAIMRARIVRVSPPSVRLLQQWQKTLRPSDRPMLSAEAGSTETFSLTTRRGRVALNEALRSRVRQLRASRNTL